MPDSSPTLQLVAQHFNHNPQQTTIGVKLRGGDFCVVPLTQPLSMLRHFQGVDGDGSRDSPFCVQLECSGRSATASVRA